MTDHSVLYKVRLQPGYDIPCKPLSKVPCSNFAGWVLRHVWALKFRRYVCHEHADKYPER